MVQFEYDGVMKRHNVRVPFTLAGEKDMVNIGAISEDNKITLHRDISLKLLRQIMLRWDEHCHMLEMKDKRETEEFNDLLDKDDEYARWELKHDLAKSIDELELTTRTYDCFQHAGIRTVGEMTEKKASEMLKLRNFGRKSLTEVQEKLIELGLTLKQ